MKKQTKAERWIMQIESLPPLERSHRITEAILARIDMLSVDEIPTDMLLKSMDLRLCYLKMKVFSDHLKKTEEGLPTKKHYERPPTSEELSFLWDWEFEPHRILDCMNMDRYVEMLRFGIKLEWKQEAMLNSAMNRIIQNIN